LVKTGQVKNTLRLILWVVKAKISYDEERARLDGSYYDRQIDKAVEEYNSKHVREFKTNIKGFEKWLKENPPA